MTDSLLPSCEQKFGTALALDQCFRLLTEFFKLDDKFGGNQTLERCSVELEAKLGQSWGKVRKTVQIDSGPAVLHNPQHFHGSCTSLELFCLRFLFPLLQMLSFGGNLFNLLVYRLPYFRGSSAVHFLRAKALANLLFVQSRLLEVRSFKALTKLNFPVVQSIHAWAPLHPGLEWLYWYSRPWLITLGNLNGTVATWLTLLVCAETVICVLWPFSLRRYFSAQCTFACLAACLGLATAIHSLFLLTHEVVPDPSALLMVPEAECFRIAVSFRMRPSWWAPLLESPFYWMQMTCTIVLPTLLMLLCSALILSRFTMKVRICCFF